jgi:hypothetical protein
VALCVIRRTREITAAELERIASFGKEEAEVYLSAHALDPADGGFEIVERVVYDGKDFLDRIAVHSQYIHRLSADIDCTYDRLIRLGALIRPLLGLGKDALIAEAAAEAPDLEPRLKRLITRFFQLLAATRKLKALRRKAYAAISGVKKSWYALRPSALVAGLALDAGDGTGPPARCGGDPGGPRHRRPGEGNAGVQGPDVREDDQPWRQGSVPAPKLG